MSGARLELSDIQGIVARGYAELAAARFLLLGFDAPAGARAWLGALAGALATSAARPGDTAVNVALTSAGVRRLGLPEDALRRFSPEFAEGMAAPARSRALGDADENAPASWEWGAPGRDEIHAVLLLYARDEPALAALVAAQSPAAQSGVRILHSLETADFGGREPFGFRDGISQPPMEGLSKAPSDGSAVKAGEFVLGYPNEYGLLTDRPVLAASADPKQLLPRDAGGTGGADLGRNGSYLVLRQLEQDVPAFWRFLDRATCRRDGSSDPEARVRLGAKMVGRWPGGAPLVLSPDADDAALATANGFAYFHEDARGARCPIGAHVRRANPRDMLDPNPGTAKSVAINHRHRILRRGREYGSPLAIDDAIAGAPGADRPRGLHFLCLNANIARQFEFVQRTWINNPKFAGLYDDSDPLVAPSAPFGGSFTAPTATLRERVTGVPRFVTVRGGAYCFLPGIAAVRYLASLPG